ncbi:hypothetical protein VTI28DRAFT_5421 [Corynascus sepedonium]
MSRPSPSSRGRATRIPSGEEDDDAPGLDELRMQVSGARSVEAWYGGFPGSGQWTLWDMEAMQKATRRTADEPQTGKAGIGQISRLHIFISPISSGPRLGGDRCRILFLNSSPTSPFRYSYSACVIKASQCLRLDVKTPAAVNCRRGTLRPSLLSARWTPPIKHEIALLAVEIPTAITIRALVLVASTKRHPQCWARRLFVDCKSECTLSSRRARGHLEGVKAISIRGSYREPVCLGGSPY